jgi:hypothetical protein
MRSPPFRWDESRGVRIGSSRVTLDSLEEIAIQFSVLSLEDIYITIAYYCSFQMNTIRSCAELRAAHEQIWV